MTYRVYCSRCGDTGRQEYTTPITHVGPCERAVEKSKPCRRGLKFLAAVCCRNDQMGQMYRRKAHDYGIEIPEKARELETD